jgi:hypothetical protein
VGGFVIMVLMIAPVAFTTFDLRLCVLPTVCCQRPANVILRLGELAALSANVTLVAFVRLYKGAWHGLVVPEERKQNNDRDWNTE